MFFAVVRVSSLDECQSVVKMHFPPICIFISLEPPVSRCKLRLRWWSSFETALASLFLKPTGMMVVRIQRAQGAKTEKKVKQEACKMVANLYSWKFHSLSCIIVCFSYSKIRGKLCPLLAANPKEVLFLLWFWFWLRGTGLLLVMERILGNHC